MSTISYKDINSKIERSEILQKELASHDFEEKLRELQINWAEGDVNPSARLFPLFVEQELIDPIAKKLTKSGLLFCGRILIDFESELAESKLLEGKYMITRLISIGKNSCTFQAEHVVLGTQVVLKFLRPGAADNIVNSLKLIAPTEPVPGLVQPWDYFKLQISDVFGHLVQVECIIFPRSEEHTSELQSQSNLVCRLLLEKKNHQRDIAFEGIAVLILNDLAPCVSERRNQ